MNCKMIKKYAMQYLDGELAETLRTEICDHLTSCPDCAQKVEQLEVAWNQLTPSTQIQAPPYLGMKVLQRVNKPVQRKRLPGMIWSGIQRSLVPGIAAAVLLIGLLVGFNFGKILYQSTTTVNYSLTQEQPDAEIFDDFAWSNIQSETLADIYLELE
ncbi:zf-HC2 domain-containing protein [candidate division KSB1 bacterium]|nr:zf-HC2 domain-containing protein [candidate division KSB1 bacterium]